jgi:hypothetical protein
MLGNQGNDGNEEAESVTKKKTALFFTPWVRGEDESLGRNIWLTGEAIKQELGGDKPKQDSGQGVDKEYF